jgi:hypothetical protein
MPRARYEALVEAIKKKDPDIKIAKGLIVKTSN